MPIRAEEIEVNLFDMVLCLARAIDFLHPAVSEHHLRVAYAASCVAEELGLDGAQIQDVLIAGALHDLAAVCSPAWAGLLEEALTQDLLGRHQTDDVHRHGMQAYLMLRDCAPFARAAGAVRFHHVDWDGGRGEQCAGIPVPLASHILRLADRVAVLPNEATNVLEQAAQMRSEVAAGRERLFHPDVAGAFDAASQKEAFWLDLTSRHKERILRQRFGADKIPLDLNGLRALSRIFGKIIDYRSSFTAAHSSGVAAISEDLAAHLGLDSLRRELIGVAGYLHDIGKLAVPPALLDKPGKLTAQEMFVIKQHPYYTHQILSTVPGLEQVTIWAALHHERLDGAGYPFRTRAIPLEARIIAVADVFTAITEDRPYRRGMERADCLAVLDRQVRDGALDGDVVAALHRNFEHVQEVRHRSQRAGLAAAVPG
ncbi:MAG TPA: HD domain-containing phosphohydrolase [Noviherbaspirillum sp.]|nr:HD domain-containing phosphohydrolase [Noviherbaspirillum sp.]